jgi:hypothetical protein
MMVVMTNNRAPSPFSRDWQFTDLAKNTAVNVVGQVLGSDSGAPYRKVIFDGDTANWVEDSQVFNARDLPAGLGSGSGWGLDMTTLWATWGRTWMQHDYASQDPWHIAGNQLPANTDNWRVVRVDQDLAAGQTWVTIGYQLLDANGNQIRLGPVSPDIQPQWGEELYGSDGNDRIESGTGDDFVWAGGGDDLVIGGTQWGWPSYVDTLLGEGGNDTLYADDYTDLSKLPRLTDFIGGTDTTGQPGYGDWLYGGAGNDTLTGDGEAEDDNSFKGKDKTLWRMAA